MESVASVMKPVLVSLLGDEPALPVRFWDGSALGRDEARSSVFVRSPTALRHLLWAPGELGLARAYVAGDIDIEGEIFDILELRDAFADPARGVKVRLGRSARAHLLRALRSLHAFGPRPSAPPEEVRLRGRLHSNDRDAQAVSHHYDVSNDFYRIILGETMTYSCAYFERDNMSLDDAQHAKYELVARKLRLRPNMRLLDVGCGWGGMVIHATLRYDLRCVGITLSRKQADGAAKRVAELGLADRIEIRIQDYRDIDDGPYDAISSIGMFEHVGIAKTRAYLDKLAGLLSPGGRLLNHAISRPSGGPGFDRNSFVARYVFPDGELQEVGRVVSAVHASGLEVRDVHSLREHYARTLRWWVSNLEANWDRAVELVGPGRARVWRLYMAGAALNFEAGRTSVHQTLAVNSAGSPLELDATRVNWPSQETAIHRRDLNVNSPR
ncbi:MAG: class I SAM-dependent methyltransferase [Actinomycetota bacterium]